MASPTCAKQPTGMWPVPFQVSGVTGIVLHHEVMPCALPLPGSNLCFLFKGVVSKHVCNTQHLNLSYLTLTNRNTRVHDITLFLCAAG